jgi:hypothetical protein
VSGYIQTAGPPGSGFSRRAGMHRLMRLLAGAIQTTKPNAFLHNRVASVATLRRCSGSSRNAVRLRRNPHRRSSSPLCGRNSSSLCTLTWKPLPRGQQLNRNDLERLTPVRCSRRKSWPAQTRLFVQTCFMRSLKSEWRSQQRDTSPQNHPLRSLPR